jgi:UDP-N-acetyl-D-galactosamine dehydrogenase
MSNPCIGIVGLGYVGLPLALAFARHYPVVGFDIDEQRIKQLTLRKMPADIAPAAQLDGLTINFTSKTSDLKIANVFIITVPTPVEENAKPDLTAVRLACQTVSKVMARGSLVILESTVYPGTTEEYCLPILEQGSQLKAGVDFDLGYSPERINPGDPLHTLKTVTKVVSGLTPDACQRVYQLYASIITTVVQAASIKVAETAKLLENTQRDVNIALMNEVALICQSLSIDTQAVIKTASTKWNFHTYQPGLVGGHCISVDPHYLRYVAEEHEVAVECVSAARKTNDNMSSYLSQLIRQHLKNNHIDYTQCAVGILGITFKEDCSDLRNSAVFPLISALKKDARSLKIHDPIACKKQSKALYQVDLLEWEEMKDLDVLVIAVAHQAYRQLTPAALKACFGKNHFLFDIKRIYAPQACESAQIHYWGL